MQQTEMAPDTHAPGSRSEIDEQAANKLWCVDSFLCDLEATF